MSTTLLIAHTFASTKVTSTDPTVVSVDQWNLSSAHTVTGTLESSNISGTLTSTQIVSIGSSQISGTLTSTQIVSIGSSQLTGTLTSTQIVSIGSSQLSTTLPASQGGTGLTSYTVGDLIVASSASLLTPLSDSATGNALISGGAGAAPSYGKIGLTTHVSGTLPTSQGGTGLTGYAGGDLIYASSLEALGTISIATSGNALIASSGQPVWGKISLSDHVTGTLGSTQLGVPFTVGFSVTPYSTGTISAGTFTPNPINGNYQYYTNGGAHTLAASTVDSAIDILMTNSSVAGAVTFSGFTVSTNVGDALTTTTSAKFIISLRRINSVSAYSITALQ